MEALEDSPPTSKSRKAIGALVVPVRFGDQVITSLLFNHDANPVHHKPDHAMQWLLGLLSGQALAGVEEHLAGAGAEERTYALGSGLLQRQDLVVMPGAMLAAICYEHFVPPEDLCVSVTTTFTYPLLVPTKGEVNVRIEGYELHGAPTPGEELGTARHLLIEAFGPSLTGRPVRLLKLDAIVYPAAESPETAYQRLVAPQFERLSKLAVNAANYPGLSHPAAISEEDRRRYARILGLERRITPLAWQAKIPRVLTEIIDHLRHHENYQHEVQAYYKGREDEVERRRAIERYVLKERKYRQLDSSAEAVARRVNELAGLTQQLYARQHCVFDPRFFVPGGPAGRPATPFTLDLRLFELRLRRGIHRFYTGARLNNQPAFMGEALVTGQPLVTRELANFLCEINHSFNTLRLFDYASR